MADNNVVLEEATKAIIYYGSLPNDENTLEIVLDRVTDVDQIQDEIVFGEFYPETSLTGQYASTDIYKGYKFISQEEPFCCIIKIFLPVAVYQIDFYKDNTPIENGSFVFYKYENFSYEYDIIHTYNGIFKYIKTYPYLEEEPELTYHKRCKISHTKDTETLVEIFDQSILSEKFADLPVNAYLSYGSQIINGNLITKDMHLLYLGNLTKDGICFDSPDGGYEKVPLVGEQEYEAATNSYAGVGFNMIYEMDGELQTSTNNNLLMMSNNSNILNNDDDSEPDEIIYLEG